MSLQGWKFPKTPGRPLGGLAIASLMLLIGIGLRSVTAQETKQPAHAARNDIAVTSASIARGKYIVEGVAVCSQCHTPRRPDGQLDNSRWLAGASETYLPAQPQANWPVLAPRIGGTPPATDAEMVTLLTTGVWKTGRPLRRPMPPFRMTTADAEAVVAYLKSVRQGQGGGN